MSGSLHHSSHPRLNCRISGDLPRDEAKRGPHRPPPPPARMTPQGYTTQFSVLLERLETQSIHELEADLDATRLAWILEEHLEVPLCPCNVCTEYGKHLVWALSPLEELRGKKVAWEKVLGKIKKRHKHELEYRAEKKEEEARRDAEQAKRQEQDEEFEKRMQKQPRPNLGNVLSRTPCAVNGEDEEDSDESEDEEEDRGTEDSDEDSDDEDLNKPPKPKLMKKLYALKDAWARKRAYEEDRTNLVARARYEGIMVKMYDDKMDALRERDEAMNRSAIFEAKIQNLEAGLAERHMALDSAQKELVEIKLQLAGRLSVQPTVDALVEKIALQAASHHEELGQKVAELADLEQRHQHLQSRYQDLTLMELEQRHSELENNHRFDLDKQVEVFDQAGGTACSDLTSSSKRPSSPSSSELVKSIEVLDQAGGKASSVLSFSLKRPLSPSNLLQDNTRPQKRQGLESPLEEWNYWSTMRRPRPSDPPEQLANWLQFRESGIKGIPLSGAPDWVIDMRDVRGYCRIMSLAPPKVRQQPPFLRELHEHGLYAILRVVILGQYSRFLAETGTSIAEVERLIPCDFPTHITQDLTDCDVAKLLAERGLSLRTADDSWQWCYKYMNEEASTTEQTWLGIKMRELRSQITSSAPPGLYSYQADQQARTVPGISNMPGSCSTKKSGRKGIHNMPGSSHSKKQGRKGNLQ